MIVECPACHTRYRTDSLGGIDDSTFFQCSQEECGHVFPYSPPLFGGGAREAPPLRPPSGDLLPKRSGAAPEKQQQDGGLIGDASSRPSRPVEISAAELAGGEDFSPLETPFFAGGEAEDVENLDPYAPISAPAPEVVFSLRPFVVFLGIVVLGYAGLGAYSLAHLAETDALLARLPLLGSLFTAERFSAQHITLTDLSGHYWQTKDNHRVFAVSGKALNNAPLPARSIQVEGMIYDTNSKVVGQRVIFCGTETAAAVLSSLTVREIGILQNLMPPKQFSVPAGQSVNFLLVFTTPPAAIAEFSGRVVAAQFGGP